MGGAEFLLLGPVEVRAAGKPVAVGGTRARGVLAALLLDVNRVVSIEQIIDAVWGDNPPAGARVQAQNRVSGLRRALHHTQPDRALINTCGSGYLISLDEDQLDAERFRRSVQSAGEQAAAGKRHTARRQLAAALSLWRGPALADPATPYLRAAAQQLEEQRARALERRLQLDLDLGRHRELVAELTGLVAAHPYRESFHAMHMLALYRAGRQAEALDAYHRARTTLAEQLGLDPGALLQRLHAAMLRGEPRLADLSLDDWDATASAQAPADLAAPRVGPAPVPRQLPRDVPGFTGRDGEMVALDAMLAGASKDGPAAAEGVAVIAGTAGVGKTALAVHWAHRVADRFPDGQLYVNLRGFDPGGAVMTAAEATRRFLGALHVLPERIPADPGAQADLYRTLLADKRMLVVLDNARDADQVRPLLPGGTGCLILITSRDRLTSLVAAEGARPLPLDLLTHDEARDLLSRRLGTDRVAAEPGTVDDLITCCARLPLALAIVAANAATRPHLSLAALAEELRYNHNRLDALVTGDTAATDVRAVFSWSYRALNEDAARLFRLLGLHPGPDSSIAAAASLAGVPAGRVRAMLNQLASAHLIVEHTPGRYAFHDLLCVYAADLAHTTDSDQQRYAATDRILGHYLHTAHAAARWLDPYRVPLTLTPLQPGLTPEHPTDRQQALDWFTAEHAVLLAAVDHAVANGFDTHTWQLVWALATYLHRQGHWHDWASVQHAAVSAAGRLADPSAEARAHRHLANAYNSLGRFDDARTHLRHALDLTTLAGDLAGQAHSHHITGVVCDRQGRYSDALDHMRQALDLFRAIGHRRWLAIAHSAVGYSHARLGDYRQALTYCQAALPTLQELGDRHGQAATWDSLGYAYRHLGHHAQAVTCYRHAIDLNRDIGDRYREATALIDLGDVHHSAGDPRTARGAWQQALALLDQIDHPDAEKVRTKLAGPDPATPEGEEEHRTT